MPRYSAELLPYNDQEIELGYKPWSIIDTFTKQIQVPYYALRISRALMSINKLALRRVLDSNGSIADFEQPFIFREDLSSPKRKAIPSSRDCTDVVIAMDALYGFIKSGMLNKQAPTADLPEMPPYWEHISGKALCIITDMVNHVVRETQLQ